MMKHSKGVMDLSKFLRSDDEDDQGNVGEVDADDAASLNPEGELIKKHYVVDDRNFIKEVWTHENHDLLRLFDDLSL